jgi:hypothetical protein
MSSAVCEETVAPHKIRIVEKRKVLIYIMVKDLNRKKSKVNLHIIPYAEYFIF